MTTAEKIEVMQAFAAGKKIQIKEKSTNFWDDWRCPFDPVWSWDSCDYRVKPEEEKPRLMTNRQLACWVTKGNGEYRYGEGCTVFSYHSYDPFDEKKPVRDIVRIRRWGSDEWILPTVDVYVEDCE